MKNHTRKFIGILAASVLLVVAASCSVDVKSSTKETVITPVFSQADGAVLSGTSVTITCATEGAAIYYTTDGNEPTTSSTAYSSGVTITSACTLKAIAVKDGMNNSAVASAVYTIKEIVAIPTFSPSDGAVRSGTSITITCSTEGAAIYYTTDGNEPTTSSTAYSSAVTITSACTLKAIAVKDGMNNSAVASAVYTIKETVATPEFSQAGGAVTSGTSVTITCATEGVKIYYTKDGTIPTAASTEYTAALSITESVTVKAIAVKEGIDDSAVAIANYNVIIVPDCVIVTGGTVTGATDEEKNFIGVFPEGRTVTLSSFYMGKYEVTQTQYKSVMVGQKVTVNGTEYTLEASPSLCTGSNSDFGIDYGKDHSNYPVENITWYDAVYYCNVLSTYEGLDPCYTIDVKSVSSSNHINSATVTFDNTKNGYRLPTEAEWEYAARGGDMTKDDWNYVFSGADNLSGLSYYSSYNSNLDSVCWYSYNNKDGTTGDSEVTSSADGQGSHEVGKKNSNRLNIYDMSGNVWEWCWDYYGDISGETVTDPAGIASGKYRIFRGGSWAEPALRQSVSYRIYNLPTLQKYYLGFRICRNDQ